MADHIGVWHPVCGRGRSLPQWFCSHKAQSCFYRGAPVLATVKYDGSIHRTVALKDADTPCAIEYYVDDFSQNYEVIFSVEIDIRQSPYQTLLRIDAGNLPLADAVHNVALWWNEGQNKSVPQAACQPLYSSWYNFHQEPRQDMLTGELKAAADLGFKTVILDDGWQIEGSGTKDYRKSGDWLVAKDKFPDFKRFVDDVHSFGQKLILWFAVPFAGYETEAYRKFRDRLLFTEDGYLYAGILDIRYADVRQYIVDTYLRFVTDYDIDGLKLDFIDNFKCTTDTPAYNDKMDCRSVETAVTRLLTEITQSIRAVKPDFLYEFRQFYVGPSILRFANMIRVADCAFDSVTNRIGIADLRMLTLNTAVHSDMLMWSPEETQRNCQFQLLNILFGVPQISVLLNHSTDAQKLILRSYLQYTEKNRDVLLKGHFEAKHPELNYTQISSQTDNKKITVLYGQSFYQLTDKNEDIWNATGEPGITICNPSESLLTVRVYDFYSHELNRFRTDNRIFYAGVMINGYVNIEFCKEE